MWLLAYNAFETSSGNAFHSITASRGDTNELQFRLMNNITKLRNDSKSTDRKLIGSIVADVLVAESMTCISQEMSQAMQDVIDEVLDAIE